MVLSYTDIKLSLQEKGTVSLLFSKDSTPYAQKIIKLREQILTIFCNKLKKSFEYTFMILNMSILPVNLAGKGVGRKISAYLHN